MRPRLIALLALSAYLLLPIHVNAQDKDASDQAWPSLGTEKFDDSRPRFIIESRRLERAPVESTPSWAPRCTTSPLDCAAWFQAVNFFSEWKGDIRRSTLRWDVVMHHYPAALFTRHFSTTGTYVFYVPARKMFYVWGDCGMGHADLGQGPFAGDPRVVFKELGDDPESVAALGELTVPFRTHHSDDDAWPPPPSFGFDVS